jgi:hypothetical protein
MAAGDRAFATDLAAVAAVGTAICAKSDDLVFMTILVPAVIVSRFVVWSRLPAAEGAMSLRSELVFFALCLGLGAFNDWNSVVRHHVYNYNVPHFFPALGSIPLWMLLYWGLILRFVATLCRWNRIAPPSRSPSEVLSISQPTWAKVTLELLLVVATRLLLYRYYLDPVLSWLPFALALLAYAALFGVSPHERRLAALAALGGPAVEIAFIRVGGLHDYHLGWFAGVPLWIVLWWILAVLIWNDLSARLLELLAGCDAPGGAIRVQHHNACFVPRRRS